MNRIDEKALYANALNYFGALRQWDKLIEEMAELQQAILKVRYNPTQENKQNLHEEIVDVQVVMSQLLPHMNKNWMRVHKRNKLLKLSYTIGNKTVK